MPLFEYECTGCHERFELLVRNGEQVACPQCGQARVEKLLSAPAVRTNGLPVASGACPPSDAPPCSPHCCRL